MEEADLSVSRIPQLRALAVNAPVRFIAMHDIGRADLVAQIFVEMCPLFGGTVAESHGRGRHERHSEKPCKHFANIAV